MTRSANVLLINICVYALFTVACGFIPSALTETPRCGFLGASSSDENKAATESSIPQLPAFGASSHVPGSTAPHISNATDVALVDRKFDLQYTCNRCSTRNSHRVSRIAYNKGVVIATCKGCKVQHLIADHLGFTKLWEKEDHGNIEEYVANQEDEALQVNRVSKDVFHLEKVLSHDTKSGSIVDEEGNLAME